VVRGGDALRGSIVCFSCPKPRLPDSAITCAAKSRESREGYHEQVDREIHVIAIKVLASVEILLHSHASPKYAMTNAQ
jgi:hypothetical protein